MPSLPFHLFSRDTTDSPVLSRTAAGLIAALVVLAVLATGLLGGLLYFRRRRRTRDQLTSPTFTEKRTSTSSTVSHHRRVMVRPSESIYVCQEKEILVDGSCSPPGSPLPEIRITFPEEYDASGKRTSGRVVVVRVGDTAIGLEPVNENLPAYQQTDGGRFQSIDLERIGGLIERESVKRWD